MKGYDFCCCAGLASDGYTAAGATMTGMDIRPQPNYPYPFIQGDALDRLHRGSTLDYDFVHASFPCQTHSRTKHLRVAQGGTTKHVDILAPGLALLRQLDVPWICENVPGAPMEPQEGEYLTVLCGSMFGLQVQRHRLFLTNWPLTAPGRCDHKSFPADPITGKPRPWGVFHVPNDTIPKGGRTARDLAHGKEVMGVPAERTITWNELKEGLPPAYTTLIGRELAKHLAT